MTTQKIFNLNCIHSSWRDCIEDALKKMDKTYLETLQKNNWLPGSEKIFSAFSLPMEKVNYVLFGESPYPREHSANGFAFWDANVKSIWSNDGLSKEVNRATSLRNMIKMLLVAKGLLDPKHTSQQHIAALNKHHLIQTNDELFKNLINHGFLLLNASLVLQDTPVKKDALAWQPFIKHVLEQLFKKNPTIQLILFGKIAIAIDALVDHFEIKRLYAEHPYNLSFIQNPEVIDFFKPLNLLEK